MDIKDILHFPISGNGNISGKKQTESPHSSPERTMRVLLEPIDPPHDLAQIAHTASQFTGFENIVAEEVRKTREAARAIYRSQNDRIKQGHANEASKKKNEIIALDRELKKLFAVEKRTEVFIEKKDAAGRTPFTSNGKIVIAALSTGAIACGLGLANFTQRILVSGTLAFADHPYRAAAVGVFAAGTAIGGVHYLGEFLNRKNPGSSKIFVGEFVNG